MFPKLLISALLFSTISNAQAPVGLGRAGAYLVLAGQTVTNTGPTIVSGGDLGVSPGTAITGFPLVNAAGAQFDLVTAYNDAAGRGPATIESTDLGGLTLVAGVYQSVPGRGPMMITTGRTLTLDAQGDPDSVWIFQTDSTLITESSSRVMLINGAQPCNVFWQVGSSATLGTGSTFVGTIMALTSISATTNAVIQGRLLARNGQVSLDTNTITLPICSTSTTTTTTTTTTSSTTTSSATTSATTTSATTTSATTTTPPIITLPIIGPIGPIEIGPILGGGIGNNGGDTSGNSNGNGNGNGSGNGNGNGNGSGNDNDNGNGNGNGSGNGNGNGNGSGNDNDNGNGNGSGNGKGGRLPTALNPYSINEHKHYHDKGHPHYGPYEDYHIAAHDRADYGTLPTTCTTKRWETSMTEATPGKTKAYNPSWATEPVRAP
ncbi:hypothetical protein N7535_004182 [Penicillium sp. DV-2018c]|nr:hypothetical protein N7535_004182 [Penicillium sp. DV-2018c]